MHPTKMTKRTIGFLFHITLLVLLISVLVTRTNYKGQIVYVKNIYGQFEGVYTMDPDGNNVNRIPTVCISHPISPVWSPDGKWIAFGCLTGKSEQNLCILDREGWTTDGTWTGDSGCYDYDGHIDIQSVSGDFCSAAIESVSWSPDGQRLAITCPSQNQSDTLVCIIGIDGTILDYWPVSLLIGTDKQYGATWVDWSPRADRLALSFHTEDMTTSGIYLTDINGKNATFLTQGYNPSWSPQGKHLAFMQGGICIIDADGKNLHCPYDRSKNMTVVGQWENPPSFFDGLVSWAPDGKSLVFVAGQTNSGSPTAIYVLDIKKNTVHQITNSYDGLFKDPDWGP